MKREAMVIMLPTKDKTNLCKSKHNNILVIRDKSLDNYEEDVENQHLYFTSDEEIKEGDWYIFNNTDLRKALLSKPIYSSDKYRKVIATTDKSLGLWEGLQEGDLVGKHFFTMPQIPQSFIEAYVKAEGKIDKVMVECDVKTYDDWFKNGGSPVPDKLKTREDNTVITSKVKEDMYTRDEVHLLLNAMNTHAHNRSSNIIEFHNLDEFIKQNLKQ